jgi:uncharacterized membrane protein YbaN (DUF454 family)
MHLRNRLLVVAGGISLAVGAVGIVVPILPTTPLVLLAAACFSTGSRVFAHGWRLLPISVITSGITRTRWVSPCG